MKLSFSDHFSVIRNHISPDLLNTRWAGKIMELCTQFPFDTSTDFGFESRLGNPEAKCDFFLQINKDSEGALMIAGKSNTAGLSPELLADPFWQRISALFAAWTDPTSYLYRKIEMIWLEFDHEENSFNKIPSIFFRIDEDENTHTPNQWSAMLQVLDEIYQILFGIKYPADIADCLKLCVEALPANTRIYQTGFMIPRKTEALRLILTEMNTGDLLDYLARIHWPGEPEVIANLLERYASKFDYTVFNFHIGKTVLPFLGIEPYFRGMKQPQWEPRWSDFFDLLENDKLLLAPKRQGLIRFCVKINASFPYPKLYLSGINHLKMVYRRGMSHECKAYFGTMMRQPVK